MYENPGGHGLPPSLLTPMRVSLKFVNFSSVGGCVCNIAVA